MVFFPFICCHKDEWLKHKKSEDIIAGKRCAIVLPSQLSRNNDILLLVSDLLTCLLSMREDAKVRKEREAEEE